MSEEKVKKPLYDGLNSGDDDDEIMGFDFTIKLNDKVIAFCHKDVLKAGNLLDKMLAKFNLIDTSDSIHEIDFNNTNEGTDFFNIGKRKFSVDIIKILIDYCYDISSLNLNNNNVIDVLEISTFFDYETLIERCKHYLINISDFNKFASVIYPFFEDKKVRFFKKIAEPKQVRDIKRELMEKKLAIEMEDENLFCKKTNYQSITAIAKCDIKKPDEMFLLATKWLKYDEEERTKFTDEVLYDVVYFGCKMDFLKEIVLKNKFVIKSEHERRRAKIEILNKYLHRW